MGVIRSSGQSSKYFNRNRKKTTSVLKFVDKSNNSKTKKVVIFIQNVATGFSEEVTSWQQFYITPNKPFYSDYFGSYEILSILGTTQLPTFIATVGKKYIANNGDIPMSGNASSVNEIQIQNGHGTDNLTVVVKKCGYPIETRIITPGNTKNFGYQPTVYLAISDNGLPLTIVEANTQLSLLGLRSADVEINQTSGVYSFTMSNIVSL